MVNTVCNLGITSSLDDGSKRELERMFGTKFPFTGRIVGGDGKSVLPYFCEFP